MPIVEVNGQEVEFPDTMSNEQIRTVLKQKFPQKKSSTTLEQIGAFGSGFGSGVKERVLGVGQFIEDLPITPEIADFASLIKEEREKSEQFPERQTAFEAGKTTGDIVALLPTMFPTARLGAIGAGIVGGGIEALTRPRGEDISPFDRIKETIVGSGIGALGGAGTKFVGRGLEKGARFLSKNETLGKVLGFADENITDIFSDLKEYGLGSKVAFNKVKKALGTESAKLNKQMSQTFEKAKELGKDVFIEEKDSKDLISRIAEYSRETIDDQERTAIGNVINDLNSLLSGRNNAINLNELQRIRRTVSRESSKGKYTLGAIKNEIDEFLSNIAETGKLIGDKEAVNLWNKGISLRKDIGNKFEDPVEIAKAITEDNISDIAKKFLGTSPSTFSKAASSYDNTLKALPKSQQKQAGFLLRQSVVNELVDKSAVAGGGEEVFAKTLGNEIKKLRIENTSLWKKFPISERNILQNLEKQLVKLPKSGLLNNVGDLLFKFLNRATFSNLQTPNILKPKQILSVEDLISLTKQKPEIKALNPFGFTVGAVTSKKSTKEE